MRAWWIVLLLAPSEAMAQSALGFGELRVSLFPGATGDVWQLVERVRPTLEAEVADRVKLVATIEAGFDQGRDLEEEVQRTLRAQGLGPLLDGAGCELPEHRNRTLRIDSAGDYLDVDRLYVDVYLGDVDLRAGRHAINWGSAQFFNPTDPFPEVLLAEPWRPRRGVNAIRASVPFGDANDVAAVIGTSDTFDELRAAARLRINWAGIDFAAVGAYPGEHGLVGLDLRGTFGVGWWIEAAYLIGPDRHEEIAVGIDYSFPIFERALLFAQYYRNGAGSPDARPALGAAFGSSPCMERDPFAPFVAGRDYFLLGGSLVVEPELTMTFSLLQNLGDGSGFVVPTIIYNLFDWLDVAFSAQVPYTLWGDGGELAPSDDDLTFAAGPITADLSGLVPDATVTLWTRASF